MGTVLRGGRLLTLVAGVLLAAAGQVSAQEADGTLAGVVRDESGAVVPGVEIVVKDAARGGQRATRSSEQGTYAFAGLRPGRYELTTIPAMGFAAARVSDIVLAAGESRTLDLVLGVADFAERVDVAGAAAAGSVTLFGRAESLREIPQSVSVVTQERIEAQGLTQLTDVLVQTTGVTLSQGGNAGSDSSPIYSRGFAIDSYQVDGVSNLHSNYTSIFQSNDMVLYERAEILRGASGLQNGVGSPGGVINLVRKRPTASRQGYVRFDAASWDYRRAEVDVSSPLNQSGSLRGRFVAAWQDSASYIERYGEDKKVVYGVLDFDVSPRTVATVGVTFQDHSAQGHARSGLPPFNADGSRAAWSRSDSAAATWASSERDGRSVFGAVEHSFANRWQVKGTVQYSRTAFDEVLGYVGGNPNPADGTGLNLWAGRWAGPPTQKTVDLRASGPFTLFGRQHELVTGAILSRTRQDTQSYNLWYWSNGWDPTIPDYRTWDGRTPAAPDNPPTGDFDFAEATTSAYATARIRPLASLSLLVGGRVTNWSDETYRHDYATDVASTTRRHRPAEPTPYLGVVYDAGRHWSVYASYTNIFKPQSAQDAAGDYLPPLRGDSVEGGVKAVFFDGQLNLSSAVYLVEQDNLAIAIPGVFTPTGGTAYQAVSGTRTRGLELELAGKLSSRWQASAGVARNVTRDRLHALLQTYAPQTTMRVYTSYAFADGRQAPSVGAAMRWQSETYTDYATLPSSPRLTQGAYAVIDLMAQYPIASHLRLTANLYNLLDETYLAGAYAAYYGEPRRFRAGLSFVF